MTRERTRRPGLTPAERSLRARIGAYAMHARNDARQTTAAARLAFLQRFEREVDPHRRLAAPERLRLALSAWLGIRILRGQSRWPKLLLPILALIFTFAALALVTFPLSFGGSTESQVQQTIDIDP